MLNLCGLFTFIILCLFSGYLNIQGVYWVFMSEEKLRGINVCWWWTNWKTSIFELTSNVPKVWIEKKFSLSFHRELLLYIFNACTNCKKIVKCNSGWELVSSPSFIKPCHLSDFTWILTVKKNAKYFEIKPDVQTFITEFTQGLLINRVMAIRFPQLS